MRIEKEGVSKTKLGEVYYMETERNEEKRIACHQARNDAYQILHFGFAILPIIAGLDKFFNYLVNWQQYLSAPFNVLGNAHTTMLVVGVIEIVAGIGVWLKPQIFAYVVMLWLLAIIINLLLIGHYYDVALRDFGLLLGALALARLSCKSAY
jgi:hypothetical protein